jgi:formylglycine-generating enzyme required for sulfatase activity
MHGNVWEWVEDCWTMDAANAPTDGSAFARPGSCELGVIRGGSWLSGSLRVRSAFRLARIMHQAAFFLHVRRAGARHRSVRRNGARQLVMQRVRG